MENFLKNGNLSAVVFGAGGFIGNHLVNKLKMDGFLVLGHLNYYKMV